MFPFFRWSRNMLVIEMSDSLVEPLSPNDLLARIVQTLDEHLPEGWETSISPPTDDPYVDRRAAPDALLEVIAPNGERAAFAVAARITLAGREATPLLARLRDWGDRHETLSLVAARYLSSTVRETLTDGGASYVDATGHVNVVSTSPAVVLFRTGADRDPWRRSSLRDALTGEPAAAVARTLCEFDAPLRIARVIELSGASPGATYRVLDLLFDEGIARKGRRGWIESVDWPALLRRWALDRAAAERRFTLAFDLPGGADALPATLSKQPRDSYVLGGAHAAAAWVGETGPRFAARQAVVHCEQPARLATRLGAVAAGRNTVGNLIVHVRGLRPAAARAQTRGKLRIAAPAQAYADLVFAGDDDAADRLLKAMKARARDWRAAP